MKVPGWIITAAISILTAAVLELNKHTLPGWILFVIALAGMTVISRKYMGTWSWWKKALGIAAYLASCFVGGEEAEAGVRRVVHELESQLRRCGGHADGRVPE